MCVRERQTERQTEREVETNSFFFFFSAFQHSVQLFSVPLFFFFFFFFSFFSFSPPLETYFYFNPLPFPSLPFLTAPPAQTSTTAPQTSCKRFLIFPRCIFFPLFLILSLLIFHACTFSQPLHPTRQPLLVS